MKCCEYGPRSKLQCKGGFIVSSRDLHLWGNISVEKRRNIQGFLFISFYPHPQTHTWMQKIAEGRSKRATTLCTTTLSLMALRIMILMLSIMMLVAMTLTLHNDNQH